MSLQICASAASQWKGYGYYKQNKVKEWKQIGETQYEWYVKGSGAEPYPVVIDLNHPRKSTCTCPHAAGRRIVCKHYLALFFTIFPQEAEDYYSQMIEYEKEEREVRRYESIEAYVYSLSLSELRSALISYMEYDDSIDEDFDDEDAEYDEDDW